MSLRPAPEKEVLFQKVLGANVIQRKQQVDSKEQSAVDRHQLQPLQTRRPARQHLRVRLFQPISIRLESKEGTFGENAGIKQRSVGQTAIDKKRDN